MLRMTTLLLCLTLLRLPSAAAAQDPRLTARLDSLTRVQVEALVTSAHDQGLPTEPLVQKALEGASKGAPGPRIVTAVESTFADLRRAREALGQRASSDEIVAAAAAIRAGATPAMVAEIRRAGHQIGEYRQRHRHPVAGGMGVDAAWRSVSELANRGGDDQAFLDLRDRLRPPVSSP
jgi:hypothetical protein